MENAHEMKQVGSPWVHTTLLHIFFSLLKTLMRTQDLIMVEVSRSKTTLPFHLLHIYILLCGHTFLNPGLAEAGVELEHTD